MNLEDVQGPADYADVFAERGRFYHVAMAAAARSRDLEFSQLFCRQSLHPGERLIDAPSGGGYLQDFLQVSSPGHHLEVINLEFTPGFSERPLIVDPYGGWSIEAFWADRIVCLAASHHIADMPALLENFRAHSRPGALIHLADVQVGSGVADFLDIFVNEHTSTGHRGIYRSFEDFRWPAWMDICSVELRACPWRFESEQQMLWFCQHLFGLGPSAAPDLREALQTFIGFQSSGRGVELNWQLVYVDARRR